MKTENVIVSATHVQLFTIAGDKDSSNPRARAACKAINIKRDCLHVSDETLSNIIKYGNGATVCKDTPTLPVLIREVVPEMLAAARKECPDAHSVTLRLISPVALATIKVRTNLDGTLKNSVNSNARKLSQNITMIVDGALVNTWVASRFKH